MTLHGYVSYTEENVKIANTNGTTDTEHRYLFKCKCKTCGDEKTVTVKGVDLFKYNQGAYIQTAFPYLSDDDKERLLTGTCPDCWDKMWKEPDDEKTTE